MEGTVESETAKPLIQPTVAGPCPDRQRPGNDPMRRFIATPYSAILPIMGRSIHLETNHPSVLQHMTRLFARYPHECERGADFRWRIVVDSNTPVCPPWPERTAFSDDGLRYAAFGQRSFLAADLNNREAIGILGEGLMQDEVGFTCPFLDNIFCLTVGSLGVVPFWANCVARRNSGVLLFGKSNSGKSSASYLAEKMGLDFHADEGVFLDLYPGGLRSWSGFWPPAFRPDALNFFPELKKSCEPCLYRDFTFYHRTDVSPTAGLPVTPVCCLYLDRQSTSTPELTCVSRSAAEALLEEYVLFRDDDRFANQQLEVLQCVASLPFYVLRYGTDPSIAASTVCDLITTNEINGHSLLAKGRGDQET